MSSSNDVSSGLRIACPRGFSLLELLVVVAIIALLISITVPAFNHVSTLGKRAKCAANLKSIGNAVQSFMADNDGFLPDALAKPSDEQNEAPNRRGTLSASPLYLLLTSELKIQGITSSEHDMLRQQSGWPGEKYPQHEVFHCPADRIVDPGEQQRASFESYYQREGTSYEWNQALSGRRMNSELLGGASASSTALLWDFETFHEGRNKLYADSSVGTD